MKPKSGVFEAPDARKFEVDCDADGAGGFRGGTDSLRVLVGQRVRREGVEEMWDSVAVYAEEEEDGTLVLRVVVFNPDWDEPLQIAALRSRPRDATSLTPLGCNLDQVTELRSTQHPQPPGRAPVARGLQRQA